MSDAVVADQVVATLDTLATDYRSKFGRAVSEPLTLVMPRWLHERVGEERLTASLKRLGIDRVELVDGYAESDRAEMMLYASGTWHTGHELGQTRVGCKGCEP